MRWRAVVVLALILAALAGLHVEALDPVRAAAILPFFLFAPGLAWVALNTRIGTGAYVVVAVSLSAAFTILVATALLFLHLWSPELGFWLLVFAAAIGLFLTDD